MRSRPAPAVWVVALAALLGTRAGAAGKDGPAETVIRGGTIVDGSGRPRYEGDVLIRGDRIAAIGKVEVGPATKVIRADGMIVAPGFIDLHTHSDGSILHAKTRANRNYQAQGVTTIVTGNCGSGPIEVGKYLAAVDKEGAGSNVIHLVPHGSLRQSVLGMKETKADPESLAKMKALVDRGMAEGAWGMSTGLIYLPGRYADTAELVELARVVGRRGGFYASHVRNEETGLLDSIDEILTIGRSAGLPVHVSHIKASGRAAWGLTAQALAKLGQARKDGLVVSADQYPYVASSTQLAAMVVPHWARQGNAEEFARLAADPTQGPRLRRAIQAELDDRDGGASVRIARYAADKSRVGRNLVEIARRENTTPLQVVLDVERHGGAQAISFGMDEKEVRAVMADPFVATASDGGAHLPGSGDKPHPRAYGTFPRKIRYALDEKVITLEQAVRSNSALPAEILHLADRGQVRAGYVADLAVFDPKTFRDVATFDEPDRYAAGLKYLFVNGVAAVVDGQPQAALPGRALRPAQDGPPDTIFRFAKVWTGDVHNPYAEAIACRAGAIIAVGPASEVLALKGPATRVVSRPDDFAMPGLIDAHGHVASLGAEAEQVDLRGVASPEEVARKVKAKIEATPGDGWILGSAWDQSLWPGAEFPTAAVLDAVAPGRPVWLRRVDGHAAWANTEAMKRAGVTAETKSPDGGQVLRDPGGKPTGVFVDAAMSLVGKAVPGPTRSDLIRRILLAQDRILAAGLTGVHDAGVTPLAAEAYRDLERSGKLKLRVYGMASMADGTEAKFLASAPIPHRPGSRFELRAVKLYVDGAMGSRGAWLFEDYADQPGHRGLTLIDPKKLEAITADALRRGWQVCTHAIGDRGNAAVLDAYEAALKAVPEARDRRLRIEHAQVVRKADVARFASLGVVASMQPSHAVSDLRWADARLGPGRVDGAYAWRWFLDAQVPLAFGSDFPVEVVNPFFGIYSALARANPEGQPSGGWHPDQVLSNDETLRAFTAGSAYAAFAEDRVGILRPGMRADLTAIDRDPTRVKPIDVLKSVVTMTVIDGEVVGKPASP